MARSQETRLILLLVGLLLLADLASVSFGRRLSEPDVDGGGGRSPPAKGYYFSKQQASPSASRRRLGDGYEHMRAVSKRLVPQGPNPLHN